jgi:hypothetical protein
MTYRGRVKNGQITLDGPAVLPEGAAVNIEMAAQVARISRPPQGKKPRKFEPIRMPCASLAEELVRDRW